MNSATHSLAIPKAPAQPELQIDTSIVDQRTAKSLRRGPPNFGVYPEIGYPIISGGAPQPGEENEGMANSGNDRVSLSEAARRLGVSKGYLSTLVKEGKLSSGATVVNVVVIRRELHIRACSESLN